MKEKFKIYEENGKQVIQRLVFPRIRIILDDNTDNMALSKAVASASEFIKKGHLKKGK